MRFDIIKIERDLIILELRFEEKGVDYKKEILKDLFDETRDTISGKLLEQDFVCAVRTYTHKFNIDGIQIDSQRFEIKPINGSLLPSNEKLSKILNSVTDSLPHILQSAIKSTLLKPIKLDLVFSELLDNTSLDKIANALTEKFKSLDWNCRITRDNREFSLQPISGYSPPPSKIVEDVLKAFKKDDYLSFIQTDIKKAAELTTTRTTMLSVYKNNQHFFAQQLKVNRGINSVEMNQEKSLEKNSNKMSIT